MRIILASNSPRRKKLLNEIIPDYEAISSNFDESIIQDFESDPTILVKRLAFEKANEVLNRLNTVEDIIVIGADTVVYFEDCILGKPKDEVDAYKMLSLLENKKNTIYTGLCVITKINNESKIYNYYDTVNVYFKPMTCTQINNYVATKEPMDKAGAYTIEGYGAKYIEKIDGDFNTGLGLNQNRILEILKENGII